jgi:hypothetical protein
LLVRGFSAGWEAASAVVVAVVVVVVVDRQRRWTAAALRARDGAGHCQWCIGW